MKKSKITIIVLLIIFAFILSYLAYNIFFIFDTKVLRMDIEVSHSPLIVGINTDTDAIHFGRIAPLGKGYRVINISNNDKRKHLVSIKVYGNISKWIYVSDNNFVLQPGKVKEIKVTAEIPSDAKPGYYSGKFKVIFYNLIL